MFRQNKIKTDFVASNLPKTRVEVFKDVLKLRFSVFLKIGLYILIAFIPYVVLGVFEDTGLATIYTNYMNKNITLEIYRADVASVKIMFALMNVVSLMIISVPLSGAVKIIKYLIWGEPVFFKEDMMNGIRENSRTFLGMALLFGMTNLVTTFTTYGFLDVAVLRGIMVALKYLVIIPIILLILALTVFYNMSMEERIQNAFYLYIKTLPLTFLTSLILTLFSMVRLVGHLLIKNILLVILIFLVPILILFYMLYFCNMFDRYINARFYPEIVGKGMYTADELENK